jgi:hypothetical protein
VFILLLFQNWTQASEQRKQQQTALAVSWSMKIDQCIVLRDTSKATILPSNFPVFQSWNQHIFPYTSFSVWKTSSDSYFQIAKLSAASPDTPPFDPRHRRIGRAVRFMETSAVVKKRGKWNNRHIFFVPLQQLKMSFLRSCMPLA